MVIVAASRMKSIMVPGGKRLFARPLVAGAALLGATATAVLGSLGRTKR
jgi:hypothetical protein